jgi:hypothetical protein
MNKDEFLALVKNHVSEHPEDAAYVSDYVSAGLGIALRKSNERAADMEVALAVTLTKRYPGRVKLVLHKLKQWNGHSALRWDDTIKELEKEPI